MTNDEELIFKTYDKNEALKFLRSGNKPREIYVINYKNKDYYRLVRRANFTFVKEYFLTNGPDKGIINCCISKKTGCRLLLYNKTVVDINHAKYLSKFKIYPQKHTMLLKE